VAAAAALGLILAAGAGPVRAEMGPGPGRGFDPAFDAVDAPGGGRFQAEPTGAAAGTVAEDQGRGAFLATVADWAGRIYQGTLARLRGERPSTPQESLTLDPQRLAPIAVPGLSLIPVRLAPVSLAADPRGYETHGLVAGTEVRALGLTGDIDMMLGTERMHQTLRVAGDCGRLWLPNQITGGLDRTDGARAWEGMLRSSWGTACTANDRGWRVTAGVRDVGGTDPTATLGFEWRPRPFSPVTRLTGVDAVRARLIEDAGTVGFEARLWQLRDQPMRLSADVEWQEDGATAMRLGTGLRF